MEWFRKDGLVVDVEVKTIEEIQEYNGELK